MLLKIQLKLRRILFRVDYYSGQTSSRFEFLPQKQENIYHFASQNRLLVGSIQCDCKHQLLNWVNWTFQVRLDHWDWDVHWSNQGRGVHQERGGVSDGQGCPMEVPQQRPRMEGQREHHPRVRLVEDDGRLKKTINQSWFLSRKLFF